MDGTCRPCTTSEVAALKGNEPPTRSPSVNPTRPLRTPVRPALSPLGRPSLATVPERLEEAGNAPAHLQETELQPKEALEASAPPVRQGLRGPDEATGSEQRSAPPCGHSDKENGAWRATVPCSAQIAGSFACNASHTGANLLRTEMPLADGIEAGL